MEFNPRSQAIYWGHLTEQEKKPALEIRVSEGIDHKSPYKQTGNDSEEKLSGQVFEFLKDCGSIRDKNFHSEKATGLK